MVDQSWISSLMIAAGVATVGGLAVAPLATLPALVLAAAVAFAGSRRLALAVIVVITLAGVAHLSVVDSMRTTPSSRVDGR